MADISDWLSKHGLSKYADAFSRHEIELSDLSELNDDDLITIGLPLGPRRRFLKAIREGTQGRSVPERNIVAERRQLTVMFIDLVGSTPLSQQLDPEDLAEVLRLFKETCAAAVAAYDGHIASYYGDGIMVFFGFPHAHEDDPERAIHAGLRIIREIPNLQTHAQLQVRIGIATGLVVVGDLRGEKMFEDGTAMGETPNLAARLQSMADPGALIIAPTTHELAGDTFEYERRGTFQLKGFAKEVEAWQVTGTRQTLSRFMASDDTAMSSLVGRTLEYKTLHSKWDLARQGHGQVALVSGEAGIGKSRLIEELSRSIPETKFQHIRFQCSPYHDASALYPVIRQLEAAAELRVDDSATEKLDKLKRLFGAPSDLTLKLAALLLSVPFEDQLGPLDLTPDQLMKQTLDMLVDHLLETAGKTPLLVLFEDAHWIDPTTKLMLDLVVERLADAPVLMVMSYRTGFDPGWTFTSNLTHVDLKQLGFEQIKEIVDGVANGRPVPKAAYDVIAARSNGVPLYVEEVTKDLIETNFLIDGTDTLAAGGASASSSVPKTLHDALMARLDRLSSAKEVAQIGAVIGPNFSFPLIAQVARLDERALRAGLDLLVEADIVNSSGTVPEQTFTYRHALIRDTAYNSLLKRERRGLHARVVEALKQTKHQDAAVGPEILAHHYTMADMPKEAIDHWYLAGQRSVERSAAVEAVTQLGRAVALLEKMDDSVDRDRNETRIQVLRAGVLRSTAGIAADKTGAAYARIRDLCNRLGETEQLFPVLNGLYAYHLVRGEYNLAKDTAAQLLDLAKLDEESHHTMIAHRAMGAVLLHIGHLESACDHLKQALSLYDPEQHSRLAYVYGTDHAAITSCFLSIAVWLRGEPDRALDIQLQAVSAAQDLKHAHSMAQTLTYLCMLHLLRRDPQQVYPVVAQLEALAVKHAFPFMTLTANVWRSWADAQTNPNPDTLSVMRDAAEAWWASGAGNYKPLFLTAMAEVALNAQDSRSALDLLNEARAQQDLTNEGWAQAETDRIEALLQSSDKPADHLFSHALQSARDQQARMFELRVAVDYLRTCQRCGRAPKVPPDIEGILDAITGSTQNRDVADALVLLENTRPS
ncbi:MULTISPECIES: adenylate/guanylate cyclase domain-containing protein [unclassified Ruegeria]|uniref:ATP-binding protein n=1 Tax=unclassified Ruegeria TaxID=2625375 RepID=UPI001487A53D|nr:MULTISPECIES: adenylate/guanylate cyclase domain-containing protein [unclassified Ruegeria]NOD36203.1 AAA family ATPase [Ruegeria sp. HKCCD7296]NOD47390.1 AAA family ATPase [Ruegeria sp. HKCCD5849]NOD53217.1 AAA family ATPase [Ruegeria sp. HKCCD5851]NOD66410.1 AAA family ATPase [Ruegeria sp. HKCCD7303]NOE34101.1 AAA family ATPase [Ruegeria sp. HKCCD7318]